MILRFDVPGLPVAKERPRFNKSTGRVYTPKRTHGYEAHVRLLAVTTAHRSAWPLSYEGPVAVSVSITLPDRRRRDVDNAVKSVLDALQPGKRAAVGVLRDDSQVAELHVYRDVNPARVGIRVSVRPLEDIQPELRP